MPSENESSRKIIALGATLPFFMAIPPIVGWYLGSWIDHALGTAPYAQFFLLFCGVISGGREVWRIVKMIRAENNHE